MAIAKVTSAHHRHQHASRGEQFLLHVSVLAIALVVVVAGVIA